MALAVRRLSFLWIGVGVGLLVVSLMTDEGVNESGLVPGVSASYIAIACGGLGLIAAHWLGGQWPGLAVIPVVVMAWFATSKVLVVWGPGLGVWPFGPQTDPLVVGFVRLGDVLTNYAVVYVALIAMFWAVLSALAWLADRVPALRRRHVGDAIRRQNIWPRDR